MTSDLGTAAAREAMAQAGVRPGDIDLIVCATSTPDETFPATATRIQARLGVGQGAAFDVQAVCSGFVYGLAVADNFLPVGQARVAGDRDGRARARDPGARQIGRESCRERVCQG